jgi:type II secretory pathway component PulC
MVAPETRLVDISGQELDRLFTETEPTRAARIVPSLTNGRPSGVKLYAIRPGSLFAALGLRNGDTLVTVDDVDVMQPEAIEKLADLTTEASWIDLLVMRKGYPLRIVVLVHR